MNPHLKATTPKVNDNVAMWPNSSGSICQLLGFVVWRPTLIGIYLAAEFCNIIFIIIDKIHQI